MSHTDVHRPWPVQLADPHNRHLLYRYPIWPWESGLTSYRNIGCGCRMCTGHYQRKARHRRDRTRWRTDRHHALHTPADQRDAIDVPPPTRRRHW